MTSSELSRFIENAERRVIIIGVNPLLPHLEESAAYFQTYMGAQQDLHLSIYCESDNENFGQSVSTAVDWGASRRSHSYAELTIHRDRVAGTQARAGLKRAIEDLTPDAEQARSIRNRVTVKQLNLRIPLNVIVADSRIWTCTVLTRSATIEDYVEVPEGSNTYEDIQTFVDGLHDGSAAGIYASEPGDELIWVYDRAGVARGIFPRAAFYTTRYARYSVWGLVFNRNGQMLLQRRSPTTKDNRGLWDKATGGHVDLSDASTSTTAKRELVEEMYLPRAEFTKHMRADLADIIDFGEWNPRKRPERYFREAFGALGQDDWVMFRAVDPRTDLPMTVNRISERLWHDSDDKPPSVRKTVFISDVYFFLAPAGHLLSGETLANDLAEDSQAAASEHKLLTVAELLDWFDAAERAGTDKQTFTDDLLYLVLEHREMLEAIAEFAKYVTPEA
ncbi:NUDIX domain-containing protein [Nocardioides marmoraquaticus]